jgi:uncharacterized membrane protein YkoI
MKNKLSLIIAALLTTALITMGIGVIRNVNARNVQPTSVPTATQIPVNEREQAYQQMIADANAKIALANQQIEQLLSSTPTQVVETTSPYLFTSEQASALAANIAGVQPKSLPELVNFNGTTAYEVIYGNGKVYIDANNGKVLLNGLQTKPTQITADQAVNIAASYLNRTDVISINVGPMDGTNVYIVQFSDGTLVYVNIYGKIVAIQLPTQASSSEQPTEKDDD